MQKRAKRSHGWLSSVFDGVPEGFLIVGADGAFVDANEAAQEIFGFTRDELIGRNMA